MTTDTRADQLIDVQALRIGMFVRLGGGWMAHPFPLSNFKISTPDQLATLRALGVTQVRWDPRLSDIEPAGVARPGTPLAAPSAAPSVAPLPAAREEPAHPATTAAATPAGEATAAASKPRPTLEELLGVEPTAAPASEAELQAQRLSRQRASLVHCERQFNEAASAYKQATSVILSDPQDAKVQLEALSNNLLDKMLSRTGPVHSAAARHGGWQSRHPHLERERSVDAAGAQFRPLGNRLVRPRRGRVAARHRQDRPPRAAAPSGRTIQPCRIEGLPGARRAGSGAGPEDGTSRQRDAGDRATPRNGRRQRLSAQAGLGAHERRRAHRLDGERLRHLVQPTALELVPSRRTKRWRRCSRTPRSASTRPCWARSSR